MLSTYLERVTQGRAAGVATRSMGRWVSAQTARQTDRQMGVSRALSGCYGDPDRGEPLQPGVTYQYGAEKAATELGAWGRGAGDHPQ